MWCIVRQQGSGCCNERAHQSLSRGPRLIKGTAHREVVHLRRPSLHVRDWPGIAAAVLWEHYWECSCGIYLGSYVTCTYRAYLGQF